MDDTVTKTVQVIGYGRERLETPRQLAQVCFPDTDYFATKKGQGSEYLFNDEGEIRNISYGLYDELINAGLGHYVEKETYETVEMATSVDIEATSMLREIMSDVFLGLDGVENSYGATYRRPDTYSNIVIGYADVKKARLLKPLDEQENGDVFVDGSEERPAIKFKVRLNECPRKIATVVEDVLAKEMAREIADLDAIGQIRFAKCFREVNERFSCPHI